MIGLNGQENIASAILSILNRIPSSTEKPTNFSLRGAVSQQTLAKHKTIP
jgi:hypothetical protein